MKAGYAADGAPGFTGPSINNTSPLTGGDGDAGSIPVNNGYGNKGGPAALLTGAGPSSNSSQMQGGAGGAGLFQSEGTNGLPLAFVLGRYGGNGGAGAQLTGTNASFTNSGTVLGGMGGAGGSAGDASGIFLGESVGATGGAGGAGFDFTGSGATLTNLGRIVGGDGAVGGSSGNASADPIQGITISASGSGGGGGIGALLEGPNAMLVNSGSIRGGNGGNTGMVGQAATVTAGGGGGGGSGVEFHGTAALLVNSGTITGGDGGSGSSSPGGVGAWFQNSGGTLINTGTITGGNSSMAGSAGAGVIGGNLTIINGGTISGGLDPTGTHSLAITFFGGTNVLELRAGYQIIGGVAAYSNMDTLRLGGTVNSSFDVSQIGAVANGYSGFGFFAKSGTSTWQLTGDNAAPMPWSIDGGTLQVSGTMANATMTVGSGGTLAGTGTVGATQVNAGGTFAPGNGMPGTSMMVSGNLAFQSGAIYLVQANSSMSSSANVSGTASLAGTVQVVLTPTDSYRMTTYDILQSAGLGGTTFSGVTINLPGLSPTLSYSGTDVFMSVSAVLGAGGGLNVNQQNVANSINHFFNSGGTLPSGFVALLGLTGSSLGTALSQISGETASGSQQTTFDAMGQFMGVMTDPFMNRSGGFTSPTSGYTDEANAYAAKPKPTDAFAMFTKAQPAVFQQRWSVWAAGFGGSQSTSANSALGSNDTTSNIYGTAVGADYLVSPDTIAGFALAGGGTNFSVANGGTGRSDLFQFGAYVRHNEGPAYISAALAYGWQDITTNRTVMATGFDQLRAEFNANAWSGRVEGGYRFVAPSTFGFGITPYAAAQFVTFDLPAYAEAAISGAGNFALAYGARDVTDTRTEFGFRTDKSFAVHDGLLTFRTRFAWAHDYDPNRSIAATFQALPGASFVVNGASQAGDSALTTASIEMKWRNGWSVAGSFEGEFSNVTNSYAGKGVVRYAW